MKTTANPNPNQCGRVLFDQYHVEAVNSSTGQTFPSECSLAAMTPQEKLLEYSLFELTNDGGAATMTPPSADFGSVAVGFTNGPQTFTWTNNSTFTLSVSSATATGDFSVVGNTCTGVLGGNSCSINVVFSPTALGARTGTLTVSSTGTPLIASLTGIGVPGATLTPATLDFGQVPVGFSSAARSFTWTNTANVAQSITSASASGDFGVINNNCSNVPGGGSCKINVVLTPTVLGLRTGTLTVVGLGSTLTASLTGNGVPAFSFSPASLTFGSVDVGATQTLNATLTNTAPSALPVPALVVTGDYTASIASCGNQVAGNGGTCTVAITFKPSTTGARPGTVAAQTLGAGAPIQITGNGIDFTIADNPASGSVIAGYNTTTVATTTPVAGFAKPLTLTCTTNAPGSVCTLSSTSYTSSAPTNVTATITTTSTYTVIGYTGSIGGNGWLSLVGIATGLLLWVRRRSLGKSLRSGLTLALMTVTLAAATLGMSGCAGKLPSKNANPTLPGAYTCTITATDGFLVHSTTYALTVK